MFYTDDEDDRKKKKRAKFVVGEARVISKLQPRYIVYDSTDQAKQITNTMQLDGANILKENAVINVREVGNLN